MERKVSKRGRVDEGRPTKRTPEVVATIAAAIASGLTDREAGIIAGIRHDTLTEWRKDPEFSEAIEKATAERLLLRLERIEAGVQGWQGKAWALNVSDSRLTGANRLILIPPSTTGVSYWREAKHDQGS